MTVVYFHNEFHLGDAIMIVRFLYAHKELLKENNIQVHYFYSDYCGTFLHELERYSAKGVIELYPWNMKPSTSIQLWIGNDIEGIHHIKWSEYYEKYYTQIKGYLGLTSSTIECSLWQPDSYLESIYANLPEKYKYIDVLIINSDAKSFQYNKDSSEMDELCKLLHTSYSIVTTKKVEGIPCTVDDALCLQDIGAISIKVKFVIAIQTAPICALYNTFTKKSVQKWFIITTNGHHYVHTGIDYDFLADGNLVPIYKYFSAYTP